MDTGNTRPHRRTALIATELKRYDIDIVALSETRFLEEGSLTEEGGYTFLWKGYPQGGPHQHGVGFAIKNELLARLPETPVGINERLMTLRIPLAKCRHATLISAYAPTLVANDEVKDIFYQALDAAIAKIPRNEKLILLGDFNARVGKDHDVWDGVIGRHGVGRINDNGLRLLTLCAEHNLVITNTLFQQRDKYKTSWMHPRSKHWHLIDYIIVRKVDQNDVQITRAMRGANCWTDHRLIRSTLKLSIRPPVRHRSTAIKKLNVSKLKDNENINAFRRTLAEKLISEDPLKDVENAANHLDRTWTSYSTILYQAAEQSIGLKERNHQDWFDDNSNTMITLTLSPHY